MTTFILMLNTIKGGEIMTNNTNVSVSDTGNLNRYGELLNIGEVMEILGIGKNSAYSLLRSGEIKGKQSVLDFINRQNP